MISAIRNFTHFLFPLSRGAVAPPASADGLGRSEESCAALICAQPAKSLPTLKAPISTFTALASGTSLTVGLVTVAVMSGGVAIPITASVLAGVSLLFTIAYSFWRYQKKTSIDRSDLLTQMEVLISQADCHIDLQELWEHLHFYRKKYLNTPQFNRYTDIKDSIAIRQRGMPAGTPEDQQFRKLADQLYQQGLKAFFHWCTQNEENLRTQGHDQAWLENEVKQQLTLIPSLKSHFYPSFCTIVQTAVFSGQSFARLAQDFIGGTDT